ncbi:hypothetical protein MNBD_CHLOROFLEXI01-3835, partial [hydrothermal vent metagenome]
MSIASQSHVAIVPIKQTIAIQVRDLRSTAVPKINP